MRALATLLVMSCCAAGASNDTLDFGVPFGSYPGSDGPETLRLDLYRRLDSGPSNPVAIVLSGGDMVGRSDPFISQIGRDLSLRGVVTIAIDYRRPEPLAPSPFAPSVQDIGAAIDWVIGNAEHLGLDPTRLVLMGLSDSATVAARRAFATSTANTRVVALVSLWIEQFDAPQAVAGNQPAVFAVGDNPASLQLFGYTRRLKTPVEFHPRPATRGNRPVVMQEEISTGVTVYARMLEFIAKATAGSPLDPVACFGPDWHCQP